MAMMMMEVGVGDEELVVMMGIVDGWWCVRGENERTRVVTRVRNVVRARLDWGGVEDIYFVFCVGVCLVFGFFFLSWDRFLIKYIFFVLLLFFFFF